MPPDEDNKDTPQVESPNEESQPESELVDEGDETVPKQLPPPAQDKISPSQEYNWAMLSHLSILLNIFTLILGPVLALIIYLVYKDRSRYVAYQSLQATIFQLIVWVGIGLVIGAMWLVTAVLSIFLVGLLCIPFSLLATIFLLFVPLASLVYGVIAAIKCSHGEDFRYWLVGDWVRGTYDKA